MPGILWYFILAILMLVMVILSVPSHGATRGAPLASGRVFLVRGLAMTQRIADSRIRGPIL